MLASRLCTTSASVQLLLTEHSSSRVTEGWTTVPMAGGADSGIFLLQRRRRELAPYVLVQNKKFHDQVIDRRATFLLVPRREPLCIITDVSYTVGYIPYQGESLLFLLFTIYSHYCH